MRDHYDGYNKVLIEQLAARGVRVAFGLLKKAIAIFGPIILIKTTAILIIFFLFILAYSAIFIVSQELIKEADAEGRGKIVSFFNFGDKRITDWTEKDDRQLHDQYTRVGNSWREGLDEFQQEQAEEYALPWSVLAAVDRILGDPTVSLKSGSDFRPNPIAHFNKLQSYFEWKDSEVDRLIEWHEERTYHANSRNPSDPKLSDAETYLDISDSLGLVNVVSSTITTSQETETILLPVGEGIFVPTINTYTLYHRIVIYHVHKERKEIEQIELLTKADTFEAEYVFLYEERTDVDGEPGLGTKRVTERKEVVDNIIENGPYYKRLSVLLGGYGLNRQNSMDLELVLELATVYDEDFRYSMDNRWLEINSFAVDFSQNLYYGTLGTVNWPLPQEYSYISSPYGRRIHPITGKSSFHTGIDIPAPRRTPVLAIADGYVRAAAFSGGYGKTVVIDHGGGYFSLYAHLSDYTAKTGYEVTAGEQIGNVGSTGRSTGPHLHFEVRYVPAGDIQYINPIQWRTGNKC